MNKIRFYRTDNIIRDIGIIWFYELLKSNEFKVTLTRNYLEFEKLDEKLITKIITEKFLFDVFKNAKKKEFIDEKNPEKSIFTLEEYEDLSFDNFIVRVTEKLNLNPKKLEAIKKSYEDIRIPYMRNSSKYGTNGSDNSFKKMQSHIEKLIEIVQGYRLEENDLSEFNVSEGRCEVCNINNTTELDYTLKIRKDSKYAFTFKGAEENGFKNNGKELKSQICFECEFLNLCALLYINLKKPRNIINTNNLINMRELNRFLGIYERNFGDKEVLRYIAKLKVKDVLIYKITTDVNKGIILDLAKAVEIENLIKEMKILNLIQGMEIDREKSLKRENAKKMVNSKNITSLEKWFLSNIMQKEGGKIDSYKTRGNLERYDEFLELGGVKVKKVISLQIIGRKLSKEMSGAEKSKLFYNINRYLKVHNRYDLERIIIEKIKKYKLEKEMNIGEIDNLFGDEDYTQIKRNMNLFLMEIIKESEEK